MPEICKDQANVDCVKKCLVFGTVERQRCERIAVHLLYHVSNEFENSAIFTNPCSSRQTLSYFSHYFLLLGLQLCII